MKILIDLSNHNSIYSGVTIYALRIISGFVKNGYDGISILCHPYIYETVSKLYPNYACIEAQQSKSKGVLGKIKTAILQGQQINSIACDVLFRPALSMSMFFSKHRTVQTIHDLQGIKINRGFRRLAAYCSLGIAIIRSHHIITISNYVKNDIRKYYPFVNQKKIQTIYNSVIVKYDKSSPRPMPEKYLLYVGMLREYKNILTLLKAFNLLRECIEQKLVIIGRPFDDYWSKVVVPYIESNRLSSHLVIITFPISNQQLMQYYQHADLLVHPSLMEGFGYTPIEAAMLETPVLTTKETALYETTMGLLNYYESAKDEQVLAKRIKEVLANPPAKKQLSTIADTLSQQYDECGQARKVWKFLKK